MALPGSSIDSSPAPSSNEQIGLNVDVECFQDEAELSLQFAGLVRNFSLVLCLFCGPCCEPPRPATTSSSFSDITMNRRYHPPFSFAWPWPTTQEHEDIVHEGSNSAERRSKDSGENRRERDVELATGADTAARKVATHGLGLASRHRKRRRRMAPVTRTQIIERQIPTLSVEVPLPGDDGESSSSSSSSISSSSSVSASSSSVSSSSSTSSSTPQPPHQVYYRKMMIIPSLETRAL
ncbi:hypothetical protein AB1N83_009390 [Pleurotus pulmonarius]